MDATQAAVVLARLEAEFGKTVLAELLGAAWVADCTRAWQEDVDAAGDEAGEEIGTLDEYLFECETETGFWVSEFVTTDAFHRGRGCAGF